MGQGGPSFGLTPAWPLFSPRRGLSILLLLFIRAIDLFIVLGLCRCSGFSLVAASGGRSLVVGCGLLIAAASLVAEHWL